MLSVILSHFLSENKDKRQQEQTKQEIKFLIKAILPPEGTRLLNLLEKQIFSYFVRLRPSEIFTLCTENYGIQVITCNSILFQRPLLLIRPDFFYLLDYVTR